MAIATRPKPSVHHKKRTGQHHKHSKDYVKTYWPYLPMLLVVVIGLAINSFWSQLPGVLGASSNFSSQNLLEDTNNQRAIDAETPLSIDPQLQAAAQAKAEDMVAKNYWSHNTPDGKTPWTFIAAAGYSYDEAGENLAYGFSSADSTVTGWMNSPTHRANILNKDYTQVGFGVVSSQDYQGHGAGNKRYPLGGGACTGQAGPHWEARHRPGRSAYGPGDEFRDHEANKRPRK